jgi:integrase
MTAATITRTAKIGASTRNTALPEGAKELVIRDKDLTGFAIRIRQDSIRFVMEGRIAGTAIRRKITIGDAESMSAAEARDKAMNLRNMMKAGEDPVKAKDIETAAPTFNEVVENYLTRWAAGKLGRKAPRPESIRSGSKDLHRAMATFGNTRIDQIDTTAVRKFRAKLLAEDVSPSVKRKAFGALSLILKHAVEVGHVDSNPAAGFAPPNASPARERYLSAEELKAVWESCPALGRQGDAVMFLAAMPVRASVAMLMEWSWIDTNARTLTIPAEAAGNKAGEVFVLPMTEMAVEIITRQPTREGVVFRGRQGGPVSLGSDVKDRLDKASDVKDWRFHDLRRTVVTLLADADHEIDTDAADRWLQHKRTGIQAVYQRASRIASMRKIASSWDRTLRGILGIAAENNVVALPFAK